jgi:hypothetical protein
MANDDNTASPKEQITGVPDGGNTTESGMEQITGGHNPNTTGPLGQITGKDD